MPTIPILADNSPPPNMLYWVAVVLVAGGLGLIVIVLMGIRRGQLPFGIQVGGQATDASFADPTATTQEAERLLRLMGEAEEVCTRLGRDLDDKAQRIERMLARAEGMLGDQPLPGRAANSGAPSVNGSSDGLYTPPSHTPASAYPTRPEIVTRPVGVPSGVAQQPSGYSPTSYGAQRIPQHGQPSPAQAVLGPQIGVGGGAGAMPMHPPHAQQSVTNDPEAVAQQIFRLADAGLTPAEIAQRLGQHTGKVELILALRNT